MLSDFLPPTKLDPRCPLTVAVDFDGIIVKNRWPNIGPVLSVHVIPTLKILQAVGIPIILHTNRTGRHLADALGWLAQNKFTPACVNKTHPSVEKHYGGGAVGKIGAAIYVDDRSLEFMCSGVPRDWPTRLVDVINRDYVLWETEPACGHAGCVCGCLPAPKKWCVKENMPFLQPIPRPGTPGFQFLMQKLPQDGHRLLMDDLRLANWLNAEKPDKPAVNPQPPIDKFPTGAVRSTEKGKGRFDLIPPAVLQRDALLYQLGAEKASAGGHGYGERNWEKGIPISRCFSSMIRHAVQWEAGDRAEDHLAAVRFGAAAIEEMERRVIAGELPDSLIDIPAVRVKIIKKP